jgi:hypothetical protein
MAFLGATTVCNLLCFPMHDGNGNICGIRTRTRDGQKKAILGSKAGIFLSGVPLLHHESLVCEGPTDSVAAIALGFEPIGRPSCIGQETHVLDTLRRWQHNKTTICLDADSPGVAGGQKLAEILRASGIAVRMVTPAAGFKDLRDWYKSGVDRKTVDCFWSQQEWR